MSISEEKDDAVNVKEQNLMSIEPGHVEPKPNSAIDPEDPLRLNCTLTRENRGITIETEIIVQKIQQEEKVEAFKKTNRNKRDNDETLFEQTIRTFAIILIFIAWSVCTLTLGIMYLNDCPGGGGIGIPVTHIIGGCYLVICSIELVSVIIESEIKKRRPAPVRHRTGMEFDFTCCQQTLFCNVILMPIFIVLYGITLSIFVFVTFSNVTTQTVESDQYCHPFLFWYSFSLAVLCIIPVILILAWFLLSIIACTNIEKICDNCKKARSEWGPQWRKGKRTKGQSILDTYYIPNKGTNV